MYEERSGACIELLGSDDNRSGAGAAADEGPSPLGASLVECSSTSFECVLDFDCATSTRRLAVAGAASVIGERAMAPQHDALAGSTSRQ
jgi:hypothetical protein